MTRTTRRQLALFPDGADLPLFTGSPIPAASEPTDGDTASQHEDAPTDKSTWGWACTLDTLTTEPPAATRRELRDSQPTQGEGTSHETKRV